MILRFLRLALFVPMVVALIIAMLVAFTGLLIIGVILVVEWVATHSTERADDIGTWWLDHTYDPILDFPGRWLEWNWD